MKGWYDCADPACDQSGYHYSPGAFRYTCNRYSIYVIIDREAGEIMGLVASVCLCVCVLLKELSKWLGVQNGCCFDR